MSEVDLGVLAAGYAYRPVTAAALTRAARVWERAGEPVGALFVDVGGGTGDLAAEWARRGAAAVVVDPSPAMLAGVPAGVAAVRGVAEALPLAGGSAAGALFHMSLHHTRWQEALGEAARVLRPGGWLGIWTMGPDDTARTMMARWFPSVPAVEARRFPHPDRIRGWLAGAGFGPIDTGRSAEPVVRTAGDWQAAVRARFVSTLQLLPPGEVDDGLARFAAAHPDPDEVVRYQRRFTYVLAQRSGPPGGR